MSTRSLIDGLNQNLAGELGTIIRYINQAGHCEGPAGLELRRMFAEEIQDETGHAQFLCERHVFDCLGVIGRESANHQHGFFELS